jgi:hypothetical protein
MNSLFNHSGNLVFGRNICFVCEGIGTRPPNFFDNSVRGLVALNIVDHHVSARPSKRNSNALPNAGIGASYQRSLASQHLLRAH